MSLSDAKIRALKPKEKPYKATDAHRLYLAVQPNGSKLWRFGYTFASKQQTLSLGAYPLVTLLEARMARDRAKAMLVEGIDPSAAKRADPAAPAPSGETFSQVSERWFKVNAPKWVGGYAVRLRNRISQDVAPVLGNKPIASISAKEVLECIRKIEARGAVETARRVHQIVSQVFRFAVAEGLIQVDPARDIGDALAPKPPVKHRSAMPAAEIPEFLKAVREYQGEPCTIWGLQMIIHTFVRTNELRLAEWSEFADLGRVDKRDSHGALIVIQAGICDGDQLGTRLDVGRGMGVS